MSTKVDRVEIDTTLDQGRTHVAINDEYAGSINTYNNFLTKFGAWLAGKAVSVKIGGENVYANTNSLQKFLFKNLDNFEKFSLDQLKFRDLNTYTFKVLPRFEDKDRFMSAHITQATKDLLAKDLFKAIAKGDTSLALKQIRKGAELDSLAWLNENTGEFFFSKYFSTSLPARELPKQKFTHATPLLLATRLNEIAVTTLLGQHNADPTIGGETLLFSRDLMDSKYHTHYVPTTRYETVTKIDGSRQTIAHYGLNIQTHNVRIFMDHYDNRFHLFLNPDGELDYVPQPAHSCQWDTQRLSSSVPLI